ncbi:MAG: hypothetical protein GEV09_26665, partial [Pseudonocardiaceae bacterium]|nr:hypothetical protein [Pseudonocardiaceae bacterium]
MQPVLPLTPAEATPIGPIAGLVEDPDEGGVVFVSGLATFAFTPGDELARRLAAVQLVTTEIARASEVAAGVSAAIDTAAAKVSRPGKTRSADVDRGAISAIETARTHLQNARAESRTVPSRVPLRQIRPQARLLHDERKLITHAIRMAAYNAESTLARMLRPYYAR